MSERNVCLCGRKRLKINETNWNRHLTACNVAKLKNTKTVTNILSFMAKKRTIDDEVHNQSLPNKDITNINIEASSSHYSCSSVSQINVSNTSDIINTTESITDLITNSKTSLQETELIKELTPNTLDIVQETELIEELTPNTLHIDSDLYPNDPGKFPEVITNEMLTHLMQYGPCQPLPWELSSKCFPTSRDCNGVFRKFHESYYYNALPNESLVKRTWLSYSISTNKVYCISCKLFGLPKAKKVLLAQKGTNDWKHLKRNLENYAHTTDHLQAEISRGLFSKNIRVDLKLRHSKNQEISENQEVLRAIIKVLLFSAKQNIALRGHDEALISQNQGNFIEMLKLIGDAINTFGNSSSLLKKCLMYS